MSSQVKIIADSITPFGARLITYQLRYWRAIHAEFMTHRALSKNASSSRAIPVAKMIEQVRTDPAGPLHWGANQPGMQAGAELTGSALTLAQHLWREAARGAANNAEGLMKLGLHKQVANRVLEPFQWINVVATGTDWGNFYELRCHPDAQPEMQELAQAMRKARDASHPRLLQPGDWHLPFVTPEERESDLPIGSLLRLSTARCARSSYNRHDGTPAPHQEDFDLHDKLVVAKPAHMSPAEHQAVALTYRRRVKNFTGWRQYRDVLESR